MRKLLIALCTCTALIPAAAFAASPGFDYQPTGAGNAYKFQLEPTGPSFNCNCAKAPDEVAICQDPELSNLDRETARLYSEAMNYYRGGARASIRRDQVAWLRQRHHCGYDKIRPLRPSRHALGIFGRHRLISNQSIDRTANAPHQRGVHGAILHQTRRLEMNSKEYVREHMKVQQLREGKFRLTINIDFSSDTDCPLSVNSAPMNAGKPGARVAKWLPASRFATCMVELFAEDMAKHERHVPEVTEAA